MNSINKNKMIHQLYDTYGVLLTDKQQEYFEYYYFEDFSLAEIADLFKVSRNAVHTNLNKSLKILEDYEEKLGLIVKFDKLNGYLNEIKLDENIIEQINEIFF